MPFGVSSGIPNVIIHAKFTVNRLRGLLIGTTLTTVLHYRADCDNIRLFVVDRPGRQTETNT